MESTKIVKFAKKEWYLKSSAYTIIEYQQVFGTDLLDDLDAISNEFKKSKKQIKLTIIITKLMQMFYILQNQQKESFEIFMNAFKLSDLFVAEDLKKLFTAIMSMFSVKKKSNSAKKKR